jgi:hypothetical protein
LIIEEKTAAKVNKISTANSHCRLEVFTASIVAVCRHGNTAPTRIKNIRNAAYTK